MKRQNRPRNPCRGCENRHSHCHVDCEPYLAYFNWNREQDYIRIQSAKADDMHFEGVSKAITLRRLMRGKLH